MASPVLTPSTTVGALAAAHPAVTRVFARRGIDFCCGGGKTLEEVCQRRGLDVQALLRELAAELEREELEAPVVWTERSPAELIDHLLERHHDPLREELRRLHGLALKVVRVHGGKEPERLPQLADTVTELEEELVPHLEKEERILFPWILSGRPIPPGGPIERMMFEHERAGQLLAQLRTLTDGYTVPQGACTTWRALWSGLEALERDLQEHMHLENNILFPRAAGRA